VFGAVLLNDWSARDIQAWEYQPLGPFLAKSFATTISPWIVTMDALEPYRAAAFKRPAGDPAPLPYLADPPTRSGRLYDSGGDVSAKREDAPGGNACLALVARQLQGCVLDAGANGRPPCLQRLQPAARRSAGHRDAFGRLPESVGSMLELTQRGANRVRLPTGETRAFVADGDEVIQRGHCAREGCATIGFGEASGTVLPAISC